MLILKALAKAIPKAFAKLILNVNKAKELIFSNNKKVNLSVNK